MYWNRNKSNIKSIPVIGSSLNLLLNILRLFETLVQINKMEFIYFMTIMTHEAYIDRIEFIYYRIKLKKYISSKNPKKQN